MKKFLQKYGCAGYLGATLSIFGGLHLGHWQWWIIAVPTIILIKISRDLVED